MHLCLARHGWREGRIGMDPSMDHQLRPHVGSRRRELLVSGGERRECGMRRDEKRAQKRRDQQRHARDYRVAGVALLVFAKLVVARLVLDLVRLRHADGGFHHADGGGLRTCARTKDDGREVAGPDVPVAPFARRGKHVAPKSGTGTGTGGRSSKENLKEAVQAPRGHVAGGEAKGKKEYP